MWTVEKPCWSFAHALPYESPTPPILIQLYEKGRESTDRVMECQLSVLDSLKNLIGGSKSFGRVGEIELPWAGSLYSVPHLCSSFARTSVRVCRPPVVPSPNRSARPCCNMSSRGFLRQKHTYICRRVRSVSSSVGYLHPRLHNRWNNNKGEQWAAVSPSSSH